MSNYKSGWMDLLNLRDPPILWDSVTLKPAISSSWARHSKIIHLTIPTTRLHIRFSPIIWCGNQLKKGWKTLSSTMTKMALMKLWHVWRTLESWVLLRSRSTMANFWWKMPRQSTLGWFFNASCTPKKEDITSSWRVKCIQCWAILRILKDLLKRHSRTMRRLWL